MADARSVQPFWQFLAEWLRVHSWTQTQLADAVGVHQTVVSKWLHADIRRRARPGRQTMAKLSEVLDVPLDQLLPMLLSDQSAADEARETAKATKTADAPADTAIRAELDTRLARLATTLSQYPRVFWLAVVEASERMATAGEALHAAPPVSATSEDRISAADQAIARPHHAKDEGLAKSSRAPLLAAAW